MPTYRITGPDGGTYEVSAPEGASEQQVLDFAKGQFGGGKPAAPKEPAAPTATAPTSGVAMGLRDPVDAGAQMLRRVVPDAVGNAVDTFGNWLADKGLPVARSEGVKGVDAIVKGVNDQYDQRRQQTAGGQEPGFDWARLGGNMLNPVNYVGGGSVAAARTIPQLALAGAKAGAVSGAMQPVVGDTENFWTAKAGQAAGGAAAGAVATPVIAKGTEAVAKGVQSLTATARGAPNPDTIRVQVTNILRTEGIDPGQAPREVLDSVQRQVNEAMSSGARLDPATIMRRARFEAVGLTGEAAPTLGQVTRDPMQWANEKNLSGVRIRTPQGEGNPLADRFQAQNDRLQEVFRRVGAGEATDRVTAGQTILDSLRAADAPVRANVDEMYTAARAMTGGRAAELDRGAFSTAANQALDEGMWGRFVPEQIRGLLNDITAERTPFTVDAAEQIDGILSAAQRRAGQGSPEASAIGVIRRALHDAPFVPSPAAPNPAAAAAANTARTVDDLGAPIVDVPFREMGRTALPASGATLPAVRSAGDVSFQIPQPTGAGGTAAAAMDEGAAAREAFAQARAAARNRFARIEDTPALRAALDNVAPDRFVQDFILNANVRDVQAMRRVLENSPDAMAQARAQVAEHLRFSAFRANASGDKAFNADAYNNLLRAIGPQKLGVFFTPSEVVQLNLAGRVASDITSKPAGAMYATNSSGTGAAVMNLLSKISQSPILRQLPGARAVANQVGEIRTEQEITRALAAQAAQEPRQLSPEAMRTIQRLFPAAGVAGGVLGGAAVN